VDKKKQEEMWKHYIKNYMHLDPLEHESITDARLRSLKSISLIVGALPFRDLPLKLGEYSSGPYREMIKWRLENNV
jgi:hypothetical protein